MKILVIGASGFIGKALVQELRQNGDNVYEHTRQDGDILTVGVLDKYEDI